MPFVSSCESQDILEGGAGKGIGQTIRGSENSKTYSPFLPKVL